MRGWVLENIFGKDELCNLADNRNTMQILKKFLVMWYLHESFLQGFQSGIISYGSVVSYLEKIGDNFPLLFRRGKLVKYMAELLGVQLCFHL